MLEKSIRNTVQSNFCFSKIGFKLMKEFVNKRKNIFALLASGMPYYRIFAQEKDKNMSVRKEME